MAIITSNGLYGTDGVQPDGTSIAATGDAPTFLDNTRLLYDDTHLVRGRVPIQFSTGYRRTSTGRIRFDLPATGPWSARWYVWMPDLQAAGLGIDEVRWHVGFPDTGLGYVTHTTAAGNAGTRLQPDDLDQSAIIWDVEDGSAVAADQLWRVELLYDGTDLTSQVYAGNDTVSPRIHIWNNRDVGRTLELTAYRYRRDAFLPYGNGSFDQEVQDYQNFLIDLGYPAPLFGADGFYGDEMAGQLDGFAGDHGFSDLIGTFGSGGGAGAEVLAGIDLAWQEDQAVATPPPLWIGNFTITDTGAAIGPLDLVDTDLAASVAIEGAVTAEDTTLNLAASVSVSGAVEASRSTAVDQDAEVAAEGQVTLFKETSTSPVEAQVAVEAEITYTAESLIPPPPPVPPQARLVVYNPDGSYQGILPNVFSWEASMPLNDVGSMTLTYSAAVPGTEVLLPTSALYAQNPFEIALEFKTARSSQWVEPPHCRFISLRRKRDLVDRTQTVSWTLANYGWMLRKAKIIESLVDGERSFTSVSAGGPLNTAYDEAIARGSLNGMIALFTDSVDSSSNSWNHPDFDITYPAGADMLTMVDAFTEQGLVDWRFDERSFQLYNAGTTMQRDRSEYILRLYGVAMEAPEEWAYDDYSRRVTALYGTSNTVTRFNTSGADYWGRWDDFINMTGGGAVLADATDAADSRMAETQNPRREESRRYAVDGIQPIPMIDYLPGDLVGLEIDGDPSTVIVTSRVHQITYSYDADRILKSTITVGDRFIVPEVQMRRRIDWTTNRASRVIGAGSGKNLQ